MLKKIGLYIFCLCLLSSVYAKPTAWQILPKESQITFQGIQNDAPFQGQFTQFTGEIFFDREKLAQSYISIQVAMNSVTSTYPDLASTLLTPAWFHVKQFPTANFSAKQFSKLSENQFAAEGKLSIRGQTVPIHLIFIGQDLSQTKAQVKGSFLVKRSAFGIGQGEWADTETIKDEVKVNFIITAQKIG